MAQQMQMQREMAERERAFQEQEQARYRAEQERQRQEQEAALAEEQARIKLEEEEAARIEKLNQQAKGKTGPALGEEDITKRNASRRYQLDLEDDGDETGMTAVNKILGRSYTS